MATVEVPSGTLAYELSGAGDPLVLVAGTGYPGATWPPAVVQALAARHTVLTFDHRGTGGTPPGRERYSTRGFATDAVDLLDALGLPAAHVVGHSMGGRVAQWMALDHPERVRSLVLAATGPGQFSADRPVTRGIPVHTALELIELGYAGYMARAHRPDVLHAGVRGGRAGARRLADPCLLGPPPDARGIPPAHRRASGAPDGRSARRHPHVDPRARGRSRHPRRRTGVHRDQSGYLAQHIAGSTLVVLPDVTHGYFWQAPHATVAALLEWTAGH